MKVLVRVNGGSGWIGVGSTLRIAVKNAASRASVDVRGLKVGETATLTVVRMAE